MPGEVPLYYTDGRLLAWVAEDWCEANAAHLRIVRSRRGHPTRAYLRSDDGELTAWLERMGRRSSYGSGFLQHLPCGRRTWALRGVRGSR